MNKTFLFFMVLFLLLTGCALTNNNQQGVQLFERKDALRDNKDSVDYVTYREGEITDIADRNPNFLDLNTENEAHNNRGAYQQKLRELVESSEEFEPEMIYINGYKAIVNVKPTKKLSKKELKQHKEALESKLTNAVPRYQIELRVN